MCRPSKIGSLLMLMLVGFAFDGLAAKTPSASESTESRDRSGRSEPFPSPEELDRLAEKAPPATRDAFRGLDVDSWELTGPFPEKIGVTAEAGETAWEQLVAELARQRAGLAVPTAAMHCVARQLGHFYLANQATPSNGLQAFIASRCNASVPRYHVGTLNAQVPAAVPEAELFAQWREQLGTQLRAMMTGGPRTLGVWFGREGDRVVVMMVAGTRRLHLEPMSGITGEDGRFTLVGEVLEPAAEVRAMIGRGRFGYRTCELDAKVALPRFSFTCEADPGDERAIATVSYTPPGRLLAKSGLHVLVWPTGKPDNHYVRPSYGKSHNVATAQALRSRLVAALNDVRADAGLEPVSEAKNQSAIASELAPHYFAATRGLSAESDADVVVMGMLAGWSVEGLLQSGNFTSSWVTETTDVNRLLSEALQYPNGRAVLLDPDIDLVAVGAIIEPGEPRSVLAAVIGTYALYSESEQGDSLEGIYERFQAARSERELQPAERLDAIESLSMAVAGQIQSGVPTNEALSSLLQASAEILQRPVNGWIAEVASLDDLEFPDDFLNRQDLGISVGVSYHKPPGDAWGRYIVTIVAAGPQSRRI